MTEAVRRTNQGSQESEKALFAKYVIDPKNVIKWKKPKTVKNGPRDSKSLYECL